jgi:hypothetical protein
LSSETEKGLRVVAFFRCHARLRQCVRRLSFAIRKNQLLADRLPDDPCHFITAHPDDRILDFDLAHGKLLQSRFERDRRCDLTAAKTTGVPLLIGRYYSQLRGLLRVPRA